MVFRSTTLAIVLATAAVSASAQEIAPAVPAASQAQVMLPMDTMIQVTPMQEITSKKMKEGDSYMLQVATDVSYNGVVVIPRGAPVKGTISWRTGKGVGGKSAKFEMTFDSVTVHGQQYALKGKHRQEGKGNTVAALLGSMFISGHSAVMLSGQIVTAFTAVPISST